MLDGFACIFDDSPLWTLTKGLARFQLRSSRGKFNVTRDLNGKCGILPLKRPEGPLMSARTLK